MAEPRSSNDKYNDCCEHVHDHNNLFEIVLISSIDTLSSSRENMFREDVIKINRDDIPN